MAQARAGELRSRIDDYLAAAEKIPSGLALRDQLEGEKRRLLRFFGATEAEWRNWHWQLRHRIRDAGTLARLFGLDEEAAAAVERVGLRFRWAISPYYACLVAVDRPGGPIWRQAVPSPAELEDTFGYDDPMCEELTSPAPAVTRRYPDRLIINVTNRCAMFCRHCQRRRNIGEVDRQQSRAALEAALDYVRAHREIRDVLITGGDALLLSNRRLEWILRELHHIPHVEIKRLGTRVPVTLPQRITPELCAILEKYPPIYINTQFNHPLEITPEAAEACARLVRAGVVLGNQAVLLRGVNDDEYVMKKLCQELLRIRVRPYYLFHAKPVRGTGHFITSVDRGLAIMEKLRGYTSGLAVPTYIINVPGGYGKVPAGPNYVVGREEGYVYLRTWENRIIAYPAEAPALS